MEDNAGLCINFFFFLACIEIGTSIKRVFKERLKINNF